ncbi:MAG: MFS transporter [Treponema sp.]|jgi:fucose permease|nr:MFS transporter [Treponema sp.]
MEQTKKSRTLLMFILYGTMFVFGFLENIKGVSYPLIKNEFDVSYETQGMMISILSISYTLFVVAAGFMLGHFGAKKIYFFGLTCSLLALSSIYLMPGFWTAASSLFFLFAGFGIFEIAVNGVATQLFIKKAALMMSLLHFMYGAGAIAGPKAAGILADPAGLGMQWRQIYLLSVPLVLIIFIPLIFAKFPAAKGEAAQKNLGYISALKTPSVWIFGITLGVMIGLEMASPNWGGLYFQDLYGMDPTTRGANFVSVFFILFTLSRLTSGFIIEKIGYMNSLIGAVLICSAIFITGFALGETGIYVLPLLGFFLAIFWPTLMAVAIGYFGNNAPIMTSAIIAIAGLLNAGIQLVMGYINQWAGAGWGYRSCLLFAAILICLLLVLKNRMKLFTKYAYTRRPGGELK